MMIWQRFDIGYGVRTERAPDEWNKIKAHTRYPGHWDATEHGYGEKEKSGT